MSYPKISLEAARVNAGLTQSEAAKQLGIAKETLGNYERGKTIPNWDTVQRISELYNFPADYILFSH